MIKHILSFLFFAILVFIAMVFLVPTEQKVTKEITIYTSPTEVYNYLKQVDNFHEWAIWSKNDSTLQTTLKEPDGEIGAISEWKGIDELSGSGHLTLKALLENEKIEQLISFKTPKAFDAISEFTLEPKSNATKLSWTFSIHTPRPGNIFNFMSSMDKAMGEDFENSLYNIKEIVEGNAGLEKPKEYTIHEFNFPTTSFLVNRKQLNKAEAPSFFNGAFEGLQTAIKEMNFPSGSQYGFYFEEDENTGRADVAAGVSIKGSANFSDPNLYQLNANKAIYVDYFGDYSKKYEAYDAIDKYVADKKWKLKSPKMEQYIATPATVKDTTYWHTKIIYLIQ